MPASFAQAPIPGLVVVQPRVFPDSRGYFLETYKDSEYRAAGIVGPFTQSNHSCSARGVLRGLHYQLPPHEQGKLVRVVKGRSWDVAVDIRRGSPTFGRWFGLELSGANHAMLWIPGGFAHGFQVLEDDTHLLYQCTAEYHAAAEAGIRWDDPALGITWPLPIANLSAKDRALPVLADAVLFPAGYRFGSMR
jgi:dTDP-4-dehydrorhamnose 3,5-epimerase